MKYLKLAFLLLFILSILTIIVNIEFLNYSESIAICDACGTWEGEGP